MYFVFVVAFAFISVGVQAQDGTCGLAAPEPNKTCISIRLPWNPQPLYFCTDKENFKYRDQCHSRYSSNCGFSAVRQNKLMIATPWDCCPITSDPDSCSESKCSPPPLNRECRELPSNPNTPWECCPTYFCEADAAPQTCHFKQLDPTCNSPPQGKTNCVAFIDTFGCCPKFYCDEDSHKHGECPAEVDAKKYMARFASSNSTEDTTAAAPQPPLPPPHAADSSAKMAFFPGPGLPIQPGSQNLPCISDSNCPGDMKCCSSDMNVYLRDSRYTFRNRNPTYGYCTESADKSKSSCSP